MFDIFPARLTDSYVLCFGSCLCFLRENQEFFGAEKRTIGMALYQWGSNLEPKGSGDPIASIVSQVVELCGGEHHKMARIITIGAVGDDEYKQSDRAPVMPENTFIAGMRVTLQCLCSALLGILL